MNLVPGRAGRVLIAASLIGSGTAGAAGAATCPNPSFETAPLIVAPDGRDRAFFGGLSLGDVDGDGSLDLFATRGYDVTVTPYQGDGSILYLNDGWGHFRRVEAPFIAPGRVDSGSTLADVDGDGDLDIYVTAELHHPNHFYRNLGHGRFEEQPLGDATSDRSSDFAAAFADIDGDGDLDLYLTGPTLERAAPSPVFRNDGGRFVAVTGTPIDNGTNNPGASLWTDVDNDGDLDLFVANSDVMRTSHAPPAPVEHGILYRNRGPWDFAVAGDEGFASNDFPAVGAAFGDVDNDGDLDLFIGAFVNGTPHPDWLFLNDGRGRFTLSGQAFPAHREEGFGAALADLNGDGDLDLVASSYNGVIRIFVGHGDGTFSPAEIPALATAPGTYSSIVTGDLDGDGRIDVVVGSWGERPDHILVLRNRTPRCAAWAELIATSRAGAVDPPGTRISFVTRHGTQVMRQLREASAQTGFRSQSGSVFLFAVPPGHRFVEAQIRWPDGRRSTIHALRLNRRTAVREPARAR